MFQQKFKTIIFILVLLFSMPMICSANSTKINKNITSHYAFDDNAIYFSMGNDSDLYRFGFVKYIDGNDNVRYFLYQNWNFLPRATITIGDTSYPIYKRNDANYWCQMFNWIQWNLYDLPNDLVEKIVSADDSTEITFNFVFDRKLEKKSFVLKGSPRKSLSDAFPLTRNDFTKYRDPKDSGEYPLTN